MWIFSQDGFFSVVKDAQHAGHLLVRGRDHNDIARLAALLGLPSTAVIISPEADYRYRASVDPEAFAALVAEWVEGVTYPNFKDHIARTQGGARERLYHEVWRTMLRLQERSARNEPRR